MRENRTSGSEGGEAQTNELSLPLSLRRPVAFPVWEDPPWSDQVPSPTRGIPSVGGPSVVRSDRRAEAAPTALVSALEQ